MKAIRNYCILTEGRAVHVHANRISKQAVEATVYLTNIHLFQRLANSICSKTVSLAAGSTGVGFVHRRRFRFIGVVTFG